MIFIIHKRNAQTINKCLRREKRKPVTPWYGNSIIAFKTKWEAVEFFVHFMGKSVGFWRKKGYGFKTLKKLERKLK